MSKKNFPTVIPLSVSSTGSISLQRSTTFNGIPGNSVFQYPQPDRYPCNLPRDQRQHRAVNFQYPQPDRYPCNRITRKPFDSSVLTFSILNRIDIPATQTDACTERRSESLSVSSTGSISLQQ